MVDFGATAFEGSITPSETIVNPVEDRSGETLAAGLGQALGNFNQFLGGFLEDKKAKAGELDGGIFREISEFSNMMADGVEQGVLQGAEARSQSRVKMNQLMADNPGQEAAIQKAFATVMGDNGLASPVLDDTPQEKAQKAKLQEALEFGWGLDPGATEEEAVTNYVLHQRAAQKLKDTTDRIAQIKADGEELTVADTVQATQDLHGLVISSLPWVHGLFEEGLDRLKGVSDPAARAAIISDVEQQYTQHMAIVGDMRTRSGNAIDTSYMTAGFEKMLESFKSVANGAENDAQLKILDDRRKKDDERQTAIIRSLIMADPEMAIYLTLSNLIGNSSPVLIQGLDAGALRLLEGLSSSGANAGLKPGDPGYVKPSDIVGLEKEISLTMTTVKDSITNAYADPATATEAWVKETSDSITGMFLSIQRNSTDGMDPLELGQFMKFMADPIVGKFIEENMQEVSPELRAAADQVTGKHYTNVGIDLINERWVEASVAIEKKFNAETDVSGAGFLGAMSAPTTENVSLSQIITPTWNGAGIQFVVNPEYKNDAMIGSMAADLNAQVAPALNNLVRAKTHMDGSRDYKKMYDEFFSDILWVGKVDPNAADAPAIPEDGEYPDNRGLLPDGVELQSFTGGVEEPILEPEKAVAKSGGSGEGLFKYLVDGRPDSYITDLEPSFANAVSTMLEDAPPEFKGQILINSGARSYQKQAELYAAAVKKYGSEELARHYVAPPGKSKHNHGIAIDFAYVSEAAGVWLRANAAKYGLWFPMGHEDWHAEPTGSRG